LSARERVLGPRFHGRTKNAKGPEKARKREHIVSGENQGFLPKNWTARGTSPWKKKLPKKKKKGQKKMKGKPDFGVRGGGEEPCQLGQERRPWLRIKKERIRIKRC